MAFVGGGGGGVVLVVCAYVIWRFIVVKYCLHTRRGSSAGSASGHELMSSAPTSTPSKDAVPLNITRMAEDGDDELAGESKSILDKDREMIEDNHATEAGSSEFVSTSFPHPPLLQNNHWCVPSR